TEWFPVRERAFGMAIFNSGAALGSIIAPPLIVWIQLQYGWQATFLITGVLGFLWLALWLMFYRSPQEHPFITGKELARIEDKHAADGGDFIANTDSLPVKDAAPDSLPVPSSPSWRDLLKRRQVWAIVLSRLCVDPVWWLYIFWLPEYLNKVHGFSLKEIGLFAWVPYVAADAGSLSGGFASGYLIRRGWSVNRARKFIIALSALMMPAGILA